MSRSIGILSAVISAPWTARVVRGAVAGGLCILVSCNREDAGLRERALLLEAEMEQQKAEVEKVRKALAAAERSGQEAAKPPDLEAAKRNYLPGVESFRTALAGALPDASVGQPSVFPVEGPETETPIRSKVTYQVSLPGGRTAEIAVPLLATARGEWKFPDASHIAGEFRKNAAALAARASAPAGSQSPASTTPAPRPEPKDVMGAERTVRVGWGDEPQPQQPERQPTQTSPPSRTETPDPGQIKKVMPSTRDVIIDFGD